MLLTIGMACIPNSTNLLMIPEMNLQCDKQIAHDGHPEVVAVVLKQIYHVHYGLQRQNILSIFHEHWK